jgi:hypothetical protein
MPVFQRICTGIHEHTGEILRHFESITQDEPWIHLPADYRANFLHELIPLAADLALVAPRTRSFADACSTSPRATAKRA